MSEERPPLGVIRTTLVFFFAVVVPLAVPYGLVFYFASWRPIVLVAAAYAIYGLTKITPEKAHGPIMWVAAVPFFALIRYYWVWLEYEVLVGWAPVLRVGVGIAGGVLLGLVAMLVGSAFLWALLVRFAHFVKLTDR